MKRPVRRVALYGYLGSGNIGNDATLETVAGLAQFQSPGGGSAVHQHRTRGISARYGIPSRADGLAFARSGWQPSDADSSQAARPVARHSVAATRWPARLTRSSFRAWAYSRSPFGVRPWGLPFGLFLMAAACRLRRRPLCASRCRSGMGAESSHQAAVRRHGPPGDTRQLPGPVVRGSRWPALVLASPRQSLLILLSRIPPPTLAKPEPGRIVVGVMAYYGQGDDPTRGARCAPPVRRNDGGSLGAGGQGRRSGGAGRR